ncbi:MAG: hypothetical protein FJ403_07665, partial [Verrucomicrobia bacterium]|nr:hypothetical protein [Verrucomicrobiota bacterium]
MNRHSQRGVALVITLLMLSVVTIMAVVFLAVSRRDKASVTVTQNQTDAGLMAEAALARAQAEIAARMLATTNAFSYEMIVSTNYFSPAGFRSGIASPMNVSYTLFNGQYLSDEEDILQNIANLQYDPRPPVFIPIANPSAERDPVFFDRNRVPHNFRFYLDFNRNRRFEPNGWQPVMGSAPGRYVGTNGVETTSVRSAMFQNFIGDPEWIGVLERPDRPHSESNRFVGRYAFIVLPAGKSLDLNFIHNNVKGNDPNLQANNYSRNQGIGSWEINLAGGFHDLNTNVWRSYVYRPGAFVASVGDSFDDARAFLFHRYYDAFKPARQHELPPAQNVFGPSAASAFRASAIDYYSDGLIPLDNPAKAWPGSPNPEGYYDMQEIFDTNQTSPRFVARLASRTTNSLSSYDRYTVYRMLAQFGTDSQPAESSRLHQADFRLYTTNKLHLNYRNDLPGGQTNLIPWNVTLPAGSPLLLGDMPSATSFFYQTADRLLRASLRRSDVTNNLAIGPYGQIMENVTLLSPDYLDLPRGPVTHFVMGTTAVRNDFCLTNIQVFHVGRNPNRATPPPNYATNNEYSTAVHQQLQVAANLYDSTTTRGTSVKRDYPTVFRPLVGKSATNVFIGGYVEFSGTNVQQLDWQSSEAFFSNIAGRFSRNDIIYTNVCLTDLPWVVGAKKGFPNFNEFTLQTVAQVSRKLELGKTALNSLPTYTNQMHVLSITNRLGMEAWNSYTQAFQGNLGMQAFVQSEMALHCIIDSDVLINPQYPQHRGSNYVITRTVTTNFNVWPGYPNPASFRIPITDTITFLTNQSYLTGSGIFTTNNVFEKGSRVPQWMLHITNRLQYILFDHDAGRIVDFVNLDKLVSHLNLTQVLMGNTNAGAGGMFSDRQRQGVLGDNDMWNTNRIAASLSAPSMGVTNQIGVSAGLPYVGEGTWRSATGDPVAGRDKEKAI